MSEPRFLASSFPPLSLSFNRCSIDGVQTRQQRGGRHAAQIKFKKSCYSAAKRACAGKRGARQGVAGKTYSDVETSVASWQPEIELRVYVEHQERQRPQFGRELCRRSAIEFRNLVHRGLWQPGTLRSTPASLRTSN